MNERQSKFVKYMFAILLATAMTIPSLAQGVEPSSPDDLVNLTGGFIGIDNRPGCGNLVNAYPVDRRVMSDGSNVPWTVPAGHKFVITGFDWVIRSTGGLGGGSDTIFLTISTGPFSFSSLMTDVADPGTDANQVVLSGTVIGPGLPICVSKSGPWDYSEAHVRGHLVRDRGGRP